MYKSTVLFEVTEVMDRESAIIVAIITITAIAIIMAIPLR
jgi:hypothetical protein